MCARSQEQSWTPCRLIVSPQGTKLASTACCASAHTNTVPLHQNQEAGRKRTISRSIMAGFQSFRNSYQSRRRSQETLLQQGLLRVWRAPGSRQGEKLTGSIPRKSLRACYGQKHDCPFKRRDLSAYDTSLALTEEDEEAYRVARG